MTHDHPLDHRDPGRVAVLMGGRSAEREISLASGAECLAALHALGVDAEAFDPAERLVTELVDYDRAFIALHGPGGEDGVIQGALEAMGVPYTGSGVLASALGMDKLRTKGVWQAMGLPTPAFRVLRGDDDPSTVIAALGLPLFVKPLREGSSMGTARVDHAADLATAAEQARAFGDAVLVERCIEGPEYTVALLDGQVLPAIRIEVDAAFYDYRAKYQSDATRMVLPCGLSAAAEAQMGQLAQQAFAAIDASGWGRVDLMADEAGALWLLEVNTIPGMTDHSLVPAAAAARGMAMDELVARILLTSWRRGEAQ
ncbi:D-alanine--D-alanine ligase [Spiribacter vilamensis]|uniref:D-alanine--D-alanine ligase n=1 Tax=Spiribacter vilamensis TaxID=531306 RepID=A0A4Q8CY64_9GAMM|nr:D-alanine--D-alanine ligase [Spiribacter vilamensis]RZU97916.1 D-alanine-D-alanine ligase [Spiribacter vilamensis]TVO61171.1 D-alanine--D-alanine ligase [Spiribacter vilamensis]